MKINDSVLFALATGQVFSGRILSLLPDERAVVKLHDSNRQETVPLADCVPLGEAYDTFVALSFARRFKEAEARAVTPPASPALDASQPGQSPDSDPAAVTVPGPVTAGGSQSPAPSPELASAATAPAGDSATAADSSSVTPPALPLL